MGQLLDKPITIHITCCNSYDDDNNDDDDDIDGLSSSPPPSSPSTTAAAGEVDGDGDSPVMEIGSSKHSHNKPINTNNKK